MACHAEQEAHPLARTVEMVFLCKKCRKAFRKDMATYEESVVRVHGLPYASQSTPMHPTAHLWPRPWPLPLPSLCHRCRPLRTTPVAVAYLDTQSRGVWRWRVVKAQMVQRKRGCS